MITIPGCGHMICTQCFSGHFEERITSQNVRCFVCPVCGKPDIPQSNFPQQIHEYFISLSYLVNIKSIEVTNCYQSSNVDHEVY